MLFQTSTDCMDNCLHQGTFQCGDTSFPKDAYIKLPEQFKTLNVNTSVANGSQIEIATQDQSSCEMWHELRCDRITASNFGRILSRKALPTESFLSSLFCMSSKNIKAESLEYGRRNESYAKAKYLKAKPKLHLHKCGLVINNAFPFLGASPDAKVCDSGLCGILEVKCPYTARNLNISEAVASISNFMLEINDDNVCKLKKNHTYYAQVQGQMLVTGADFCDFVVVTQNDMHIEGIIPDRFYMSTMLIKLATFYTDFAESYIKQRKENSRSATVSHSSYAPMSCTIGQSSGATAMAAEVVVIK